MNIPTEKTLLSFGNIENIIIFKKSFGNMINHYRTISLPLISFISVIVLWGNREGTAEKNVCEHSVDKLMSISYARGDLQ